jgi:hypothetical protein
MEASSSVERLFLKILFEIFFKSIYLMDLGGLKILFLNFRFQDLFVSSTEGCYMLKREYFFFINR